MIKGPDFAFSWTGKPGKKFQSRKDQVRQKLSSLANSIYCKYFKDADLTPHGSMATLIQLSKTINSCVSPNEVRKLICLLFVFVKKCFVKKCFVKKCSINATIFFL